MEKCRKKMSRANIKVDAETREIVREVKRDETWDECLRRLAQLDKATRVRGDVGAETVTVDGEELTREEVQERLKAEIEEAMLKRVGENVGEKAQEIAAEHRRKDRS